VTLTWVLVDTNVWSEALRRDTPAHTPHIERFRAVLRNGVLATTGVVVQELFQGFHGPKDTSRLRDLVFAAEPITPDLHDHIEASAMYRRSRRQGIQLKTVDALIATMCLRADAELLTLDRDFDHLVEREGLRLWQPT
jgi:predicted nucleic acid-binding protein